jgi:hypothetical protein
MSNPLEALQTTPYLKLNDTSSFNLSKNIGSKTMILKFNETPPSITSERLAMESRSERDHLQPHYFENPDISNIGPGDREEIKINSPLIMNSTSVLKQQNSTIRNETSVSTPPPPSIPLQVVTDVPVYNPNTVRAMKNEPSVANNGQIIFYTANDFQAYSPNGGAGWGFSDPKQDFPAYCCDQDVIYDPIHNVFILTLQGEENSAGENVIRIQLSRDLFNWMTYDIKPTDISSVWRNQNFDYPQLAISNNFIYITADIYRQNTPQDNYSQSIIMRLDTNSLLAGRLGTIQISYDNKGTITPVQGAKDNMYFATISAAIPPQWLRIYLWPEIYQNAHQGDVQVPPFIYGNAGQMNCPSPDGLDWCRNAYSKVTGGYVIGNTLGFMWNAQAGGSFPYPYVDVVVLNPDPTSPSRFKIVDNPIIYSTTSAVIEAYVSPNNLGDLGFVAFNGGPNLFPSVIAGITTPLGGIVNWYTLTTGTNGPQSQEWGDYIRVRADSGLGSIWIASGYTLQGGSTEQFIVPRFYSFQK